MERTPQELKLKSLKFLNNIYTKYCTANECRNAAVILMSNKGDKRDPKNYGGISIVNSFYQTYSKIPNIKLQR